MNDRVTIELDLGPQALLAKRNQILQKKMFDMLKEIADEQSGKKKLLGALVVLGVFAKTDYKIVGMKQIQTNPLEGRVARITEKDTKEALKELFSYDGALIVDQSGQMLAARVYVSVDHADLTVDDECSTRHLTAASASTRDDIIATFTISEQTGKVRWYVKGKQHDIFDPSAIESDKEEENL